MTCDVIRNALGTAGHVQASRMHDLPALLVMLGAARGAEVGVEQGHYSAHLLQSVPALTLLSVDAWRAYPGYREHVTQGKLERFYAQTCARLASFGARSVIRRGWSADVAASLPPASLDFVYLDGNHGFASVREDLAAWVPTVRSGGLIAGHDYGRASVGQVREAVDQWTAEHGITEWWVLAGDRSPSFLWVQA